MMGFSRRDQSGLTLVEILVAVAILMIGLVAVMQWFPLGTAGVETGRRQSTGVFLAEQKIEQIKAWALSTGAGQGFATVVAGGTCFTAANAPCANDAYNAIPGYPEYNRTVTITCMTGGPPPVAAACPGGTVRMVRVQVGYRRVTGQAVFTSDQQVDIATIIAQH